MFSLQVPEDLDVKVKATLLGAVFLIVSMNWLRSRVLNGVLLALE